MTKPDIPTLTKRIVEEASLPKTEEDMLYKFNRHQLLELYVFITELKKTNEELITKIQEMNKGTDGDNNRSDRS
jgi:hypothetical protein